MNCNNFQSIADELARGRLMDAAQREDALTHADSCAPCAARLADGRALTAGLRTLAAQAATREAPARVETALLAAFRQRHAPAAPREDDAAPMNAPAAPVTLLSSRRPIASLWSLPRWAQGAAVAAASVLLAVGLYGIFRERSATEPGLAKSDAQKSVAAPAPKSEEKTVAAVPAGEGGVAADVAEGDRVIVDEPGRSEPEALTPRRASCAGGARANFQAAKFNGARRPSMPSAADEASAPAEVATEFFPLMNGGLLAPGDAGHVIRVEVPRTALASFGLPVNADRAGGRVKADVLMGEDGMARAIRFVH